MTTGVPYRLRCTLTFGDIYGQILIWMLVIFVSLAAGLADHSCISAWRHLWLCAGLFVV